MEVRSLTDASGYPSPSLAGDFDITLNPALLYSTLLDYPSMASRTTHLDWEQAHKSTKRAVQPTDAASKV